MSLNSDVIIWAMLFFIVIIILGLYYSEFTPLDLNEKKKIIDMNQFVENFTSQSSSSDQAEGASQTYDRDDNSKPISFSIPEPHFDFDFGFDKDDKCHPKHKQYNEHECTPNHNKENTNEICRRCDITMNNNINKYVLKNSVPPCPDMSDYATKNMINYTPDLNKYILKSEIKPCDKVNISDYIKKSEIPACPNCPICPTCPICPICPICPEQKQCKEIYQYNIAEHPNISKYVLKSEMEEALEKCKHDKPSCPKVEEHKPCPMCPSCPKVEEQKSCPVCKNSKKIGDDEEERKKRNLPKEEDKYKQYINHLYEEEKVLGYYAGDNLFARV